mmetsp:Transcript_19634/g.34844  ORF Transcript_19634/g.34844 Transcript_19634/m.34844 type:complete len:201 (-) Transcript_19634:397-999(-)
MAVVESLAVVSLLASAGSTSPQPRISRSSVVTFDSTVLSLLVVVTFTVSETFRVEHPDTSYASASSGASEAHTSSLSTTVSVHAESPHNQDSELEPVPPTKKQESGQPRLAQISSEVGWLSQTVPSAPVTVSSVTTHRWSEAHWHSVSSIVLTHSTSSMNALSVWVVALAASAAEVSPDSTRTCEASSTPLYTRRSLTEP